MSRPTVADYLARAKHVGLRKLPRQVDSSKVEISGNSFVERFNRTYCGELLDLYLLRILGEVRQMTIKWMQHYNEERPHDSLNDMTAVEFLWAPQQCRKL